MLGYFHPIYQDNALTEFRDYRSLYNAETPSFDGLLEMCLQARRYGIFTLFMDYDARGFSLALQASGRTFAHHLSTIRPEVQAMGRAAPFFDALAVRDFEAIALMRPHVASQWHFGLEYEEDFLFIKILDGLVAGHDIRAIDMLVEDYDRVISGDFDPRLDLARALMAHDDALFDEALNELIMRHQDHYALLRDKDVVRDEVLCSEAMIFIEGLAYLRIAEQRGMKTEVHYRLIPSIVRADFSRDFIADFWLQL